MDSDVQKLVFNLMCDLKKKEIDPIDRAKLIQDYLTQSGQSARSLAIELGLPHSTVQDWLLWTRITKKEREQYESQGFNQTDIYHSLRDGTLGNKVKAIDAVLEYCINRLIIFKIKPPFSKETKLKIGELRHTLDVIERQIK